MLHVLACTHCASSYVSSFVINKGSGITTGDPRKQG